MAHIIELMTHSDDRGQLTVVENVLPFSVQRLFYIYDVPENTDRGGHRHKKTQMALICTSGLCTIFCDNGKEQQDFVLDSPRKCLILEPEDFHIMKDFKKGGVLLVLASQPYDPDDYIHEAY